MPRERWVGYIKDYDGGTLMECYVHPTIDYTAVPETIKTQKAFVNARIKAVSQQHVVHDGLQLGEGVKVRGLRPPPTNHRSPRLSLSLV